MVVFTTAPICYTDMPIPAEKKIKTVITYFFASKYTSITFVDRSQIQFNVCLIVTCRPGGSGTIVILYVLIVFQ